MTTITKEFNLLDVEDIEKALSKWFEREIKISEVDCTLIYCIPCDGSEQDGSYMEFNIGEEGVNSLFLFGDETDYTKGEMVDGKELSYYRHCLSPKDIFNFPISRFKSFVCDLDNSD